MTWWQFLLIALAVERALVWIVVAMSAAAASAASECAVSRFEARWAFIPAWPIIMLLPEIRKIPAAWRYAWPRKDRYGPKHTDEPRAKEGVYR